MKKYLIFRTDRIGDFLFTLKIIKIIKSNNQKSEITVIASENNKDYIKSFKGIDKIIALQNNFFSKIKLIFFLRKEKYDAVIVHDGKNRSKFISFFLKYKKKTICLTNLINTQIDIIKKVCDEINLKFDNNCLNFLDDRNHKSINLPFNNYIHLHYDEKWNFNDYIKKYINIEPNEKELINFINNILIKNKNLVITTGKKTPKKIINIKEKFDNLKVRFYENQTLLEIENIVFNSELLISCHGWISHIASAKKIRQIDIIDTSYPYSKWTSHFRNYHSLNRETFDNLSKKILDMI